MLNKSEKHNPNYLCKIIRIQNLRKHVNADRLLVFNVDGNEIITSNATTEGTIGIYFPLECTISERYLAANNEFKSKERNNDPESKGGFFEDKCRVKALRLRGEKSMGYVAPVDTLNFLFPNTLPNWNAMVGTEFDTVNDELIVKKYVVARQQGLGSNNKGLTKAVKKSKLIDNQFRLHYDTVQLGKNIHKIKPEDIISISWKLHGTSFVSSKILCKRKLKWYERIAKRLGVAVVESEYDNIYSSRKVIKNESIDKNLQHYYKYDLWKDINEQFKDNLIGGETIYGECVGFTKDGGAIQKGYDYGCKPNEHKTYIYRITHTSPEGKVIDLPFNMVQQRAEQLGAETVPFIYFGPANRFVSYEDFNNLVDWREALLELLSVRYVYDQNCQFCTTGVPAEGIVIRVEGLMPEALKLKAFRFYEYETKALDKGEINIEDNNEEE